MPPSLAQNDYISIPLIANNIKHIAYQHRAYIFIPLITNNIEHRAYQPACLKITIKYARICYNVQAKLKMNDIKHLKTERANYYSSSQLAFNKK